MRTYWDVWESVTYSPGSEIVGLHISNMPNKMLWHTEHIAYIPMVQKSLVFTWQTCQIECYCNLNIYPVSSGSRKVSLHMSNMPNKTYGSGPLLCMVLWIQYIYFIYYLSHHSYTNLCYKVSITLLIFLHILLDHTSLLNSKKPLFYLPAFLVIVE